MENEFVDYQSALYLKELGFNELCFGAFYADVESNKTDKYDVRKKFTAELDVSPFNDEIMGLFKNSDKDYYIARPTYSQAFSFFETKFNIYSEILLDRTTYPKWCFKIYKYENFGNYNEFFYADFSLYRTKSEAELECLRKILKYIDITNCKEKD